MNKMTFENKRILHILRVPTNPSLSVPVSVVSYTAFLSCGYYAKDYKILVMPHYSRMLVSYLNDLLQGEETDS